MNLRSAPLLLPAAAFLGGAGLAYGLDHLPVPVLAGLALLPLALRARGAALLSAVGAGLLWTVVVEDLPASRFEAWDAARPVEVVARPTGHWRRSEWGTWSAPARSVLVRQGPRVLPRRLDLYLQLPGEEEPPPGGRLHLKGYLTRAPGFANARAVPPGPWRLSVRSRRHLAVLEEAGLLGRTSHGLRRHLETALEAAGGGGRGAALARALVLGDPSGLAPAVLRGLRRSGLGHLMALSGLHTGLLAGLAWLAGSPLPRYGRLALVLATVALHLLAAGPRPSLLRAVLTVAVGAAALALERPPSPANALALAALALVAARPSLVGDLGFQLTVSATAGLVLVAPPLAVRWSRRRGRRPGRLAAPMAVTVSAQLATLPWALPAFGGLSPLAPVLNLLAVPWTAVALAACLAWMALALAWPAAAVAARPLLDAMAAPFSWPAAAPAGPWWFLPSGMSSPAAALLAAALGGLAFALDRPRRRLWTAALGVVALATAALAGTALPGSRAPAPQLALIDVGQGDAVLLRDGERAVLVDGGGWRGGGDLGGRVLLPALTAEGVRRLEAVVMTHPDRDHCGGLVEVASYLPVAEVWTAPGWQEEPCTAELMRLPGARVRRLAAGDRGRLGRWRWRVLHPPGAGEGGRNERSLVILAEAHGRRALLTGDLGGKEELRLAVRWPERMAAQVLKVGHHGSGGSTGERFLDAVSPRLALISTGRGNPYGHPAPAVLVRLRRRRVRVLRTDRDGLVRLSFREDGSTRVELPGSPR